MANLEIPQFIGGMTDNFLGRDPSYFQLGKNMFITQDGHIRTRFGSTVEGNTDTKAKISDGVEYLLTPFQKSGAYSFENNAFKCTTASNIGKFYYFDGTTNSELQGPTSNSLFTSSHGSATDHRFISTKWNDHIFLTSTSFTQKPQKVVVDTNGALKLYNAGLPTPSGTAPTVNEPMSGSAAAYLIVLVWKHTYTAGNRTFITRGGIYQISHSVTHGPPASLTVAANMKLDNSTSDNFDTGSSSLVIEYYRSINNGTILYLVGSIQNSLIDGMATITDGVSDANLQLATTLYTTGGIAENTIPPVAKFVHITERGLCFYGYIQDGSDTLKNRVLQAKPGIPDAVPRNFFGDLDDDNTGITSYKGIPIFFTKNSVYRGEGEFDSSGNGALIPRRIADNVGCISHNSIVQTYYGVFFAGTNGFYWTDGYNVQKISDEINTSYQTAYPSDSAKLKISGAFDEINQVVLWTFQETANSDGIFVLYLRYGVKLNSVFSTFGGDTRTSNTFQKILPATVPDSVVKNFKAKSLLFFNNTIYRADNRTGAGYTIFFDTSKTTDPRVDTGANISAWGTSAIVYDFLSGAYHYGSGDMRKWTPTVTVTLKTLGNVSLQILADRDLQGNYKALKEIKQSSTSTWGDPSFTWGDPTLWATDPGLYIRKRNLKTPGIRCTYRQFQLTNSFTVIQKSDVLGLGTVDATAKTLTLVTVTNAWNTDPLDYYVTFENDDYTNHFLVTTRTSATVLTFSDAGNKCPANGNYKWLLRGYAKGEQIFLQNITSSYFPYAASQKGYRRGEEQENA